MDKDHLAAKKLKALQAHHAVHPRPETVSDELFRSSDFFDAHDLVQVKYELVRRVKTEDLSVTAAAEAFGFSRPSFYQAQANLEQSGLPGLLPKRPGPRGPHKLSDEVMEFVEQVLAEDPELCLSALAARVRASFGVTVHPRSIQRRLQQRQKKTKQPGP